MEPHDLGFRVIVAEDATSSIGAAEHQRGLARMRQAGVEVHHCKGIAFEWLRTVDEAISTIRQATERFGPPLLRL